MSYTEAQQLSADLESLRLVPMLLLLVVGLLMVILVGAWKWATSFIGKFDKAIEHQQRMDTELLLVKKDVEHLKQRHRA